MSTEYVRFTVRVLPAARGGGEEERGSEEPLQTLAIGAKRSETFEELRLKIQARFNARKKEDHERVKIGELQDSAGADIFDEDTIGSLYDATTPAQQHTIGARINASSSKHSAVIASSRSDQGVKRDARDVGLEDEDERESGKRRKVQPSTDADRFKIPQKKARDEPQRPGGAFASSATILVEDSQPETEATATAAGSAFARSQRRSGLGTSSPAPHSSPLVAAASRNITGQQSIFKPGVSRKVLPTPDSRNHAGPDISEHTPDQPMGYGQAVATWFKRGISGRRKPPPDTSVTQEDPIEDDAPYADALRAGQGAQSSSQVEESDRGNAPSEEQECETAKPGTEQVRTPTPQPSRLVQAKDTQATSSTGTGERITNTQRSVAHGWTKAEDDALLQGAFSDKGRKMQDILKEHGINRSASAARSRRRLLLQNRKDQLPAALNFPSSSLARPHSGSEGTTPQAAVKTSAPETGTTKSSVSRIKAPPSSASNANVSQTSAHKRWSQSDIGTLRRAIGEGLSAREIQAKYFKDRSEDAMLRKYRDFLPSVVKLERDKDSFPKNSIQCHQWTDQHNLKLRRAYKEGLNVVAAGSRYFQSLPKNVVEQKMQAYRQQMEDLQFTQEMSQRSSPSTSRAAQAASGRDVESADEDAEQMGATAAGDAAPQIQEDVDAEILRDLEGLESPDEDVAEVDGSPVIQDSYEVGSAAPIDSSPPLLRKPVTRSSPEVVIPTAEQRDAQRAQRLGAPGKQAIQSQLRRKISGGQTQLNFQREKGKAAVRPAIKFTGLNRRSAEQYSRDKAPAREQLTKPETVDISSDENESEDDVPDAQMERMTPKPPSQLNGSASAAPYSSQQQSPEHHLSGSGKSDGNGTVSSGGPNGQLSFELEQSMSAPEQSAQSQATEISQEDLQSSRAVSSAPKRSGFVRIPAASRAEIDSEGHKAQVQDDEDDESDAFQTQDPSTTLSQQQKQKKTSPTTMLGARSAAKTQSSPTSSNEESIAFQTQDPGTTLSQQQKRRKASPGTASAVPVPVKPKSSSNSSNRESAAFQTQESSTTVSQKQKLKPQRRTELAREASSMLQDVVNGSQSTNGDVVSIDRVSIAQPVATTTKPRRNVYDVPVSQSTAGSQSQRSKAPALPPSSTEKRAPGQLPRIIGSVSRLQQRRKEADAKIAARKGEREARAASASVPASTPAVVPSQDEDGVEEVPRNDLPNSLRPSPNGLAAEPTEARNSLEKPLKEKTTVPDGLDDAQGTTPTAAASIDAESCESVAPAHAPAQVNQPVVELPYPQILSGEPGPGGMLEVGRPGHSFRVPPDCVYLRSEHALFGAASRERTGERAVMRLAEDMKLSDQQFIAMACSDSEKLLQLRKLARRQRRERRVEDGLPPSRGLVPGYWQPGMPKVEEWDVNVMPGSEDSMSSRGRDVDPDGEEEEASVAGSGDEENPAYFERDRHFSEVGEDDEDENPEEQAHDAPDGVTAVEVVAPADQDDTSESESSDVEGDEEPENSQAVKEKTEEEARVASLDAVTRTETVARVRTDAPFRYHSAAVKPDVIAEATQQPAERVEETRGRDVTAEYAVQGAFDFVGFNAGDGEDQNQDDNDAELPTAPPPMFDDVDEDAVPPPSDRELQELAQSGDEVEMRVEAGVPAQDTRRSPGLGSPTLSQGASRDDGTTSFHPINTTRSNEGEVVPEGHRHRAATPQHDTGFTSSIVPPWPSSGKVRESLEASEDDSNMASTKHDKHTQASRTSKKHRRDSAEADPVERKAHRKDRQEARKKTRQLKKKASAKQSPSHLPSTNKPQAGASNVDGQPSAATANATPLAPAAADVSSKKKRKAQHQASEVDDTTAAAKKPKQSRAPDRMAMPPPALPPSHADVVQQSSLPSPDSEITPNMKQSEKKAKKRAAKRAKRSARRSSMSVSVNVSMARDASPSLAVASSPPGPAVMSATTTEPKNVQPTAEEKTKKPSPKLAASNDASRGQAMQPKTPSGKDAHNAATHVASQQVKESKKSPHKKENPAKTAEQSTPTQQQAPTPATSKAAVSIQTSPAEQVSTAPSQKKTKVRATNERSSQLREGRSAPLPKVKGKGSKPAVGASTGLGGLVDFKPHIPAAPKPITQTVKVAAKPSLFDEEDEDEESESSSESD